MALRTEFVEFVGARRKGGKPDFGSLWHRTVHPVAVALPRVGVRVRLESEGLFLESGLEPMRYHTPAFTPYDGDAAAKELIGSLVAKRLRALSDDPHRLSVFLGGGSTIFHVGREMCKIATQAAQSQQTSRGSAKAEGATREVAARAPYGQLFWTINVALAADWCESEFPPAAKVSIPQAVLETRTFRCATIVQKPSWYAAIVIVGADGCLYHEETDKVVLYANQEEVAQITNGFLESATHSVICCLAKSKMNWQRTEGQNAGPPLVFPFPLRKNHLHRYLVTDALPPEEICRSLESEDWVIVTNDADWAKVPLSRQARPSEPKAPKSAPVRRTGRSKQRSSVRRGPAHSGADGPS